MSSPCSYKVHIIDCSYALCLTYVTRCIADLSSGDTFTTLSPAHRLSTNDYSWPSRPYYNLGIRYDALWPPRTNTHSRRQKLRVQDVAMKRLIKKCYVHTITREKMTLSPKVLGRLVLTLNVGMERTYGDRYHSLQGTRALVDTAIFMTLSLSLSLSLSFYPSYSFSSLIVICTETKYVRVAWDSSSTRNNYHNWE